VQKDPFLIFLSDLSKKIALEKEHKQIMEKIDSSETVESVSESPLEGFISTLKEKLTNTVPEPIIVNEEITKQESIEDIIKRDLEGVIIEVADEKENPFTSFVSRLKDIIEKGPSTETVTVSSTPVKSEEQQIPITSSTKAKKKDKASKPTKPNEYVNELEKIKNSIAIEKEDDKVVEIKKLIEEYAEKYIKKAIGHVGESGGGTNAVQYANGGTMNGDLNVNGNYLSGGVNLLDIFSGGGGGSGDPAVNALVYANSGQWNEAYSNLVSNSAAYLSGYDISFIIAASGNWESTYTTVSNNSGYWSDAYSNLVANSANYLSGFDVGFITSNFVHLSGDTMTGNLSSTALIYSRSVLPQLPTPKIVLGQQASIGFFTTIQYLTGGYDGHSPEGRNANFYIASDLLRIYNHPMLIVKDITEEMLSTYQIFIEMVIFKKRKFRPHGTGSQKQGMSFRVPVGNDGVKPWTDFWTRSGGIGSAFADGGLIRYNHLPVSYNTETIDLTPCLNGHFAKKPVAYRDQTSVDPVDFKYLNCIVPFGGRGTGQTNPVGGQYRFGYSSRYQPLYIAFRYIAWLPENNNGRGQIVDGPLSPTIRVTNTHFPFFPNSYASSAKGFAVVDVNPNFINYYNKHFICKF
jgi:hypothetical protein